MKRTWWIYWVVVAGATVAYFSLSTGAQSILYDAIGLSAGCAMLVGIQWHRPRNRAAYRLLAFGTLALASGDVVFGTSQLVPSPADMLYISAYPLLALGIYGLVPHPYSSRRRSDLSVAVAIAIAVGIVSWAFLIVPRQPAEGVSLSARAITVGYPLLDLVLLGLVIRAAAGDRTRHPSSRCLGAAALLMLLADTSYALMEFGNSYELGTLVDAAWLMSYASFGAALLHPSISERRVPVSHGPSSSPVHGSPSSVALHPMLAVTHVVRSQSNVVRLGLIALWTGRALLVLAVATLGLSGVWLSPNLVLVAGAYAITGFAMMKAAT